MTIDQHGIIHIPPGSRTGGQFAGRIRTGPSGDLLDRAYPDIIREQLEAQRAALGGGDANTFDRVREVLTDPQYADLWDDNVAAVGSLATRGGDPDAAYFRWDPDRPDRHLWTALRAGGWIVTDGPTLGTFAAQHHLTDERLSYNDGVVERGDSLGRQIIAAQPKTSEQVRATAASLGKLGSKESRTDTPETVGARDALWWAAGWGRPGEARDPAQIHRQLSELQALRDTRDQPSHPARHEERLIHGSEHALRWVLGHHEHHLPGGHS